jgi:hypothetical protein
METRESRSSGVSLMFFWIRILFNALIAYWGISIVLHHGIVSKVIGSAILLVLFSRLHMGYLSKCPNCNKFWATKIAQRDVLNEWNRHETIVRNDETRAPDNQLLWTTKRKEQVLFNYQKQKLHCRCKFCNHDWDKVIVFKSS